MSYKDLRDFLKECEEHGELKRINKAHWNLEMSAIAEIVSKEGKKPLPALLFDEIPDYPKGFRTLYGQMNSAWKLARTMGLPEDQLHPVTMMRNWHSRITTAKLLPPKPVTKAPLFENTDVGKKIDLFKFPSPRFHELDSPNRYIGTAVSVLQRDPDEGWVNSGAYRVMVVDKNRLTFHAVEGKHGSLIMRKYHKKGQPMPIAIAIGVDPAFYAASCIAIGWGISEYNYAGAMKGAPIEIIEGPRTKLPLPAYAEIVIEGECYPGELADEGPFGEWHGYYGNLGLQSVPEPVIRATAVHYRNDPILTCAQETVPPHDDTLFTSITISERLWSLLERSDIPGVKGVWCHEMGHGLLFNVVSIEPLYTGHSKATALAAIGGGAGNGRYTIIVEDDIDPSNLDQVVWAMETRAMPTRDNIMVLEKCRGSTSDPGIPLVEKKKYLVPPKPLYSSRVVIDTCRPYEQKADWYPICKVSPELRAKVVKKWKSTLSDLM